MEKDILDDHLIMPDNKPEEIRKYGLKDKKKDFSFGKYIFIMILSLSVLFVIMWFLFLLNKKDEEINNLKYDLVKFKTKAECLENMTEMYKEKFNQILQNVLENNKIMKEELLKLRDEIDKKCNTPSPPPTDNEVKEKPKHSRKCVIF